MVTLYVGGKPVGTWAQAERAFAELARTEPVEFRDAAGRVIATTAPPAEPPVPWDPTITREEIDRRLAGPFLTFDEVRKRLGWQ